MTAKHTTTFTGIFIGAFFIFTSALFIQPAAAAEKGKIIIINDGTGGYALYLGDKQVGEARTLHLGNEIELAPSAPGADGQLRRAGKAKYKNITLKRGMLQENAVKQLLAVDQNDKDQFRISVQTDEGDWSADLVEVKTVKAGKEFSPAEEQLKNNPRHRTFKSPDTFIVEELEFAVERVERAK